MTLILPAFTSDVLRSRQRRPTVPPATGRKSGRWPDREPQGNYFQNGAVQSYGSEPGRIPRQRKRGTETLAASFYHLVSLVIVADSFYKKIFVWPDYRAATSIHRSPYERGWKELPKSRGETNESSDRETRIRGAEQKGTDFFWRTGR